MDAAFVTSPLTVPGGAAAPPFVSSWRTRSSSIQRQAGLFGFRVRPLEAFCSIGASFAIALSTRRRRPKRCTVLAKRADKPSPEIDPRPREAPHSEPPLQIPQIATKGGKIDVMSKLFEDRIIMCNGMVNDEMSQVLIAQMMYLSKKDPETAITMYINSPGGSVSAGLAIYDTMQFVPCDVDTVCFGLAASMGSFLLAAGTKGKRKSLPNSRIMIHQPLGGAQGPAADVQIQAKEILFLRDILNVHLADMTGKTPDQVKTDCDRDNFMTPEEAKEYGLIDEIIETTSWPRVQKPPRPELDITI